MKLSAPFFLLLAAASTAVASHDGLSRLASRHHDLARNIERRGSTRCKARSTTVRSFH